MVTGNHGDNFTLLCIYAQLYYKNHDFATDMVSIALFTMALTDSTAIYHFVLFYTHKERVMCVITACNAEATIIQSTRTQRFLKIIETLSCWYTSESPRRVLSYEYPYAKVSEIFQNSSIRVKSSGGLMNMQIFSFQEENEKRIQDSCTSVQIISIFSIDMV